MVDVRDAFQNASPLRLNGADLLADGSGALLWSERRVMVVADLHLEKGSGFAARGRMLPPYDTRATLERLADAMARLKPATLLCLGDSFHDRRAEARMAPADADALRALTASVDWVWITGNHDPEPPRGLGGRAAAEVALGPLVFRHEAVPGAAGELSGHLHPVATVRVTSGRVRARCFAEDGNRLVMPAFGAYAGGLNVMDPAVRGLFPGGFTVHMIVRDRVHRFPAGRLQVGAA